MRGNGRTLHFAPRWKPAGQVMRKKVDKDAACLRRIAGLMSDGRVIVHSGAGDTSIDLTSRIQADLRRIADRLDK